jgi:hypothetical protein
VTTTGVSALSNVRANVSSESSSTDARGTVHGRPSNGGERKRLQSRSLARARAIRVRRTQTNASARVAARAVTRGMRRDATADDAKTRRI